MQGRREATNADRERQSTVKNEFRQGYIRSIKGPRTRPCTIFDRSSSPFPMQATDSIVIALTTCADDETSRRIAETLVGERLATCVNRIRDVRSTYYWDGRLQDDSEVLLVIKTTESRLPALQERLKAIHPYELPELVVIPVIGGNEAYLQWVREGVAEKGTSK